MSEVKERAGRASGPQSVFPQNLQILECAFSLYILGENMTPKDPFLEGTFWDKFWRPIRSRALLFTPDCARKPWADFSYPILGEGKWGRKKHSLSGKTLQNKGNWSSQFLRDLSQVVPRTPQDTPVPLYTRTSPWPTILQGSPVPVSVLAKQFWRRIFLRRKL